jgi:hypothetical protein
MTPWVEHLSVIAERHGLSLPEFLIVDVVRTAFPMTEAEVVKFSTRFLPDSDDVAVRRCIERGWLRISAEGILEVTPEGSSLTEDIARELHQHA